MNNWVSLLIALVVGTYTAYLVVSNQWDRIRKYAEKLMLFAEDNITGSKKGKQRMAYVLDQVYQLLPGWLKVFVSRERMQEILQSWYNDIKDYLDNGKVDGSSKDPKLPDVN